MTWWTPVLYFEDSWSSSSSSDSTTSTESARSSDWQFCVVYDGDDTYNLYANRTSTGQNWSLSFLSRLSLAQFLSSTLSSSSVQSTLYVVDSDNLWRDNFANYYNSWHNDNQLFSLQHDRDVQRFMDQLLLLRDMRWN